MNVLTSHHPPELYLNCIRPRKDRAVLTKIPKRKSVMQILLCHKLIFRRCWKVRKCNYGEIALRQTSTCQGLPVPIIYLNPLIVADTQHLYVLCGGKYSQKWQLDEEKGDENELFSKNRRYLYFKGAVDGLKLKLYSKWAPRLTWLNSSPLSSSWCCSWHALVLLLPQKAYNVLYAWKAVFDLVQSKLYFYLISAISMPTW